MVGIVDPASGVGIHKPRPADVGVFLDDLEADSRLAEPNAGQQPGHAGADDKHLQLARRRDQLRLLELRVLRRFSGNRELVNQEVGIGFRDRLAGHKVHHPPQRRQAWFGDAYPTFRQIFFQGDLRLVPNGLLDIGRQAGVAPGQWNIGRRPFRLKPLGLTGQVHQGRQKRWQMGGLESVVERQISVGHGRFPVGYRWSSLCLAGMSNVIRKGVVGPRESAPQARRAASSPRPSGWR